MKRILQLVCLTLALPAAHAWESPDSVPQMDVTFPLDMAIIDPDATVKQPPYVVMFPGGLDTTGSDIRGPLGRLEALRGASKLFPASNQDPGLPVVLRGLRFHRKLGPSRAVTGYEVELQGEFNTVRVPASTGDMNSLLAGQRTTFVLAASKNFGVYSYVSTMKLDVQLQGKEIFIFGLEGDFSFREGFSTYASGPKKLTPPPSRTFLYRGERAELPTLPTI
jgi:hypothetical protein